MTTPSIKELSKVFSDPQNAERILNMTWEELSETEAGKERSKGCFYPPATYDLMLSVLNASDPKFYGVDAIKFPNDEVAIYLNVGETYQSTVIYWDNEFRVQSVGDFIEEVEVNNPEARPKPE